LRGEEAQSLYSTRKATPYNAAHLTIFNACTNLSALFLFRTLHS
jgi:hypothetical protein